MKRDPLKLTLCGFGGQGIVLSAVILGTTAVTKGGLYAVQTQSYGSEARGGKCQSELIISSSPIHSPIAEKKDMLVAMFQDAYNEYIHTLNEDGVLIIDDGLVKEETVQIRKTFRVPATQIALDLGNRMCANMVILGFISECCGIVDEQDLMEVVLENVPARFTELNRKAVQAGIAYAKDHQLYDDR